MGRGVAAARLTGEVEDTEVGFPGPEHHIAEQSLAMRLAMGTLAVLAIVFLVLVLAPTIFASFYISYRDVFEAVARDA